MMPDDTDAGTGVARLMSAYGPRVWTPIPGLFLCGTGAEPVSAISGRAGRIAAQMVVRL
jgi:phytoene dehydrogenase-like protein